MHIEYEVRVLEIDKENIIKRLEKLGAVKIGEYDYKRYVYDMKPNKKGQWLRLRTDGVKSTLTYKNILEDKIDGTRELEISVSDFNLTNEMLEIMGYRHKGYQENRRIQYELNGVEIDIDSWPMIPTYLEIEGGNSLEVMDIVNKLDLDKDKMTVLGVSDIYLKIYDIDIDSIKELMFK